MRVEREIAIRVWEPRDRATVEGLLKLLSEHAVVVADDAPVFVAAAGERVVGMVTLCVLHTLTGPKAYLDHLVVAPDRRRREIGFLERDTRSFRLRLDHGGGHGGAGSDPAMQLMKRRGQPKPRFRRVYGVLPLLRAPS